MYYIKNYNMERKIMMNKKKKIFAIIMMIAIVIVFDFFDHLDFIEIVDDDRMEIVFDR